MFRIFFALLAIPALVHATSYDFNGTTSIITVVQQASINIPIITMGCWGTYDSLGEGNLGRVMEKAGTWIVRIETGTPPKLQFTATGWTTQGDWRMNLQAVGVWGHWVVSYDSTLLANDPVLYLNGVASGGDVAVPTGTFTVGAGDLSIGNNLAVARTWDGMLAECFLYNRILTVAEVNQVKTNGPASLQRGLVSYRPMGLFGARNYTKTPGLDGTATNVTVVLSGPPIAYSPQGEAP